MRRTRLVQITAAVVALLFGGALGVETFGVHSCPRHHHGSTGARGAVAGLTSTTGAPDGAGGLAFCTCVGSCHGGAASPVPSGVVSSAAAGPADGAVDRVPFCTRRPPRPRDAYFLPFPNGPPPS